MALTLYATFPNPESAVKAVGALLDSGASAECLSILMDEKSQELLQHAEHGVTTTTGADASAGALKGAGLGLGLGVLAALASLIIPGFGLVVGGGALATAIGAAVGTTVAGAVAGGATGYLKDQGVPEKAAQDYEADVAAGRPLVAINLPCNELDRLTIQELLEKYGALNMGTYGPGDTARIAAASELVEQPSVDEPLPLPDFESHYEATLVSTGLPFSNYEPAYRYGYLLRERFPGDGWNDVEPSVRQDWELSHPGTWDRMKASIRHGWERFKARV